MSIDTLICYKCGEEKLWEEFSWHDKAKGRRSGWCKECASEAEKQRCLIPEVREGKLEYNKKRGQIPWVKKQKNERQNKRYQIPEVRARILERQSLHNQTPGAKKVKSEYDRSYHQIPEVKEHNKKRNQISEVRRVRRERQRQRRLTDIQFKIQCNLRSGLARVLNGNIKSGSAVRDLDCTWEWLKGWLEMNWEWWMSWDNYGHGAGKWTIDHDVPLSSVDLTDREQLLKVCHWTNLYPMEFLENCRKSDKITERITKCP